MNRGEIYPAVQAADGRIKAILADFEPPEITRRNFTIGLSASLLTALAGVAGAGLEREAVTGNVAAERAQINIAKRCISSCLHEPIAEAVTEKTAANLPETSTAVSTDVTMPATTTSTTLPVTTTTIPPVPQEVISAGLEVALARLDPADSCQYRIKTSGECINPSRPPSEVPFQRFDTDNPAQVELISRLLGAVVLDPERYRQFKIDTSRAQALYAILDHKAIWPSFSTNHWTGYPELTDDWDENIRRMQVGGFSYHNLVLANGATSLIAPSPHDLVSHAKFANFDSMGTAANANSLETLTPEMLEAMIYNELWSDKEYGRALTRENSRSHAEIVRHDAITKVDWPSQLQDGFFALKLYLNHLVYEQGKGGHPAPFAP